MDVQCRLEPIGPGRSRIDDVAEQRGGDELLQVTPIDAKHGTREGYPIALIRGFPPEFIVPDRIRPIGWGGLRKPSRIIGAARSESLCGLDVEKQARSDL